MKVISYKTESDSDPKTALILRKLEQLVRRHAYITAKGWRFILKMQGHGDLGLFYHIDIQSDKDGGSYAEAKMSTIERFPECAATGEVSFSDVLRMLKPWSDAEEYQQIIKLENINLLTEDMIIWLRDEVGFTSYQGGIRIPYKAKVIDGCDISEETGEICIAFSGASEEQDLFFALMVFREIQDSFAKLYPDTQIWFDLGGLQKIPAIKFWLDLLGIEEV